MISIYGIRHDDASDRHRRQLTLDYLKAKIAAEKINPEDDYDNERQIQLLKEIALSDCDYWQRAELVKLMDIQPKDDD